MTSPSDGIFNIDKPPGITSMEVVRQVKLLCPRLHVGHGGTLDPMATGVLPICLGQATKLMQFLVDGNKEYIGTLHLGITTDTYDAQGTIVDEHDPSNVTLEALTSAVDSFVGTIQQTPPMYSALKHQGRRLHELARAGIEVDRPPRTVEIMHLDIMDWKPPRVTLSILCSRGVYIRSLAQDIGQNLGCGAHLVQLRRLKTGPFHADQTVSIDELRKTLQSNTWHSIFYPPDYLVSYLNAVTLNTAEERLIRNGQAVSLNPITHYSQHMEMCRAYSADGRFVALVRFNSTLKLWQPFKVFQLDMPSPYKAEQHPSEPVEKS